MRSFADYFPEFMRAGRSMKWSVPSDLAGLQAPELRGHWVAASAASKVFNIPGLHCAQAFVAPDSALFAAWQQHAHLLGWASPLGGLATITAFRQGGAWLDEVREYIAGTLNMVDELLAQQEGLVSWQRPQAGYLGFLQFPDEFSSVSEGGLARLLYKETGVLTNSGESLGAAYTNFVRFNFASSRNVVKESIQRLLDFSTSR